MKTRLLYLSAIALMFSLTFFGQASENYKQLSKATNANYYNIVNQAREEFRQMNANDGAVKKQVKQFERWALYWEARVNLDGKFPNELQGFYNAGILKANGALNENYESTVQRSNQTWTNIGPVQLDINNNGYSNFPQMGRLNTLLRIKHPTDVNQDVLFVGAPVGGIWKSTDGGATWAPKLDNVAGIGVTDIKTVPGVTTDNLASSPIYVSTGDYDGAQVKSIGVLKSTDGGETYQSTGRSFNLADFGSSTGELLVVDANTLYVGTTTGISRSTDGGVTWAADFSTGFSGVDIGRVASSGNTAMYSDKFGGLYYNSDTTMANNWTTAQQVVSSNRHAVTVDDNGDYWVQDQSGQIRKYNSSNNSFANVGTIPPGYNSQGGYNQALLVTGGLIISGCINGHVSNDNGATWERSLNGYFNPNAQNTTPTGAFDQSSVGTYIHSDHHGFGKLDGALEFWSVNDGGLNYFTFANTTNLTPTNTYKSGTTKVLQSYSVAINPSATDNAVIAANQDNDGFSNTNNNWYAVALGDGIQGAINYNDTNIRYAGTQNGTIVQTSTGFIGELNGNGNNVQIPGASFYFPFEMNKTNPDLIYGGGNDVYTINNSGSGLTITAANSGLSGAISSIATHGNNIAATAGTSIRFSANGGATWTAINAPSNLSANITSIDFDATNTDIMYLSIAGYNVNFKVFKTTDGGASWTNLSASTLPNVVMKEVILKQAQSTEILFVATELGVYSTSDGGTTWARLGQNLPNVDVRDLDINYTADKLVVGTFGRGLWEIPIPNASLSADDFDSLELDVTAFPNPATDLINVTLNNQDLDYVMYNAVGGIVRSGTLSGNNNAIDVSNLARNLYILRVSNAQTSKSIKVILK